MVAQQVDRGVRPLAHGDAAVVRVVVGDELAVAPLDMIADVGGLGSARSAAQRGQYAYPKGTHIRVVAEEREHGRLAACPTGAADLPEAVDRSGAPVIVQGVARPAARALAVGQVAGCVVPVALRAVEVRHGMRGRAQVAVAGTRLVRQVAQRTVAISLQPIGATDVAVIWALASHCVRLLLVSS
ncbi:MAG: hypothetical protein ACRDIB_13460 [Ardenticatenaceae bacterium]